MNLKTTLLLFLIFFIAQSCEIKQGCDEDTIMYNLQHAYNNIEINTNSDISKKAIKEVESCSNYEKKMNNVDKILYYFCKYRIEKDSTLKQEYGSKLHEVIKSIKSVISICSYLYHVEGIDVDGEYEELKSDRAFFESKRFIQIEKIKNNIPILNREEVSIYHDKDNNLIIKNVEVEIYQANNNINDIVVSTKDSRKQVEFLVKMITSFVVEINKLDNYIFVTNDDIKIIIKGTADSTRVGNSARENFLKQQTKFYELIEIVSSVKQDTTKGVLIPFIEGINKINDNKELALSRAIIHAELFEQKLFKNKEFVAINYKSKQGKEYKKVIFDIQINGVGDFEREILIENITSRK
jgi:hypothetical protein